MVSAYPVVREAFQNPALEAANEKLSRAIEHLHTLTNDMREFLDRDPYGVNVELDYASRWWVAKAQISEEPTPRLGVLVGEIAYECLSCLNHVVWELASRKVGRNKVFRKRIKGNVQFPVALTPAAFKDIRWSPDARSAIRPRGYSSLRSAVAIERRRRVHPGSTSVNTGRSTR